MMFNAGTVLLSKQCSSVYKIGKLVAQQHPCSYSWRNISSVQCLFGLKISNLSSSSRRYYSFSCNNRKISLSLLYNKVLVAHCIQYDQTRAAGHSKWQNIKSTKEANDAQRALIFSRLATVIRMSLKGKWTPRIGLSYHGIQFSVVSS